MMRNTLLLGALLWSGCGGQLNQFGGIDEEDPTGAEDPGADPGDDGVGADSPEFTCDDLMDGDGDGLIDCLDPDCQSDEVCAVSCPEVVGQLDRVPALVDGSTLGRGDEFGDSECGGLGASDVTLDFTAPSTGSFVFETLDSTFDPMLRIWESCSQGELACEDQPGEESLVVQLERGQRVVVIVDGASAADSGEMTLTVDELREADCTDGVDDDFDGDVDCDDRNCGADPACPFACADDVLSGPGVVMGDTTGAGTSFEGSCVSGTDVGEEVVYEFTAQADRTYVFDTSGTSFDTVLYLKDGCLGAELACDDDGGDSNTSRIEIDLLAGQTVAVVVDGYNATHSGPFTLEVTELLPEQVCDDTLDDDGDGDVDCDDVDCANDLACQPTCPDAVLATGMVMGSTLGRLDLHQPTCGSASGAPDVSFEFTAPAGGSYTFSTDGSSFDTTLYVLDGCGGTEFACDDDGGVGSASELTVTLTAGQTVLVVVDGYGSSSGDFVLEVR